MILILFVLHVVGMIVLWIRDVWNVKLGQRMS